VTGEVGLIRGIRRWDLVALVINSIIGAGIFGLPSKVFAEIGAYSLLAFVACAAVVVLIVLCFAEVSSRFTGTGGPYLYATEVFGPLVGFQIGWLLWLARLMAFATICNLFVEYLGYFWPSAGSAYGRGGVITTVVIVLTIVNLLGVRASAVVSNIFTVGKLIPLLLFVAVGALFVDPQSYALGSPPSAGSFSKAVLLLVYAFTGFEIPIITAGEVSNPRHNFPFALLSGIAVVVLLYVSIQAVCIGTLPELADSTRPLADAASRVVGAVGAAIISAGALVSMTGTLSTTMLACSRLPFAMAEQRQLPLFLMTTHRRFHTPYVSIVLSSAVLLALTLWWDFIAALTISTISRLLTYAATCAALPLLRRQEAQRPAAFTVPAGVVVCMASLVLIAWLLLNSSLSEARDVAIAAAAGLALYLGYRIFGKPSQLV
jgi:amino acid transporter